MCDDVTGMEKKLIIQ